MLNVEQLKRSVNRMELDDIRQAVDELQMDGLVTDGKTPFTRVHFNTCFAEIEALFQRAGFHRPLDVVGYQGEIYALYDPSLGGRGSAALVEGIPRGIASPDSGVSATPASAQLVCQARAGHPHDQHHQRTEGPHGDPRKAPGLFRSEQACRIHRIDQQGTAEQPQAQQAQAAQPTVVAEQHHQQGAVQQAIDPRHRVLDLQRLFPIPSHHPAATPSTTPAPT